MTVFALMIVGIRHSDAQNMVLVKGGAYTPIYGNEVASVKVSDFYMDIYPVTVEQFAHFVKDNIKWRRSRAKKIFSDGNYLINWANDTIPGNRLKKNSPVTNISWFAANDYCICQGKRLPTIDEWEYVAMADQKMADARKTESYNQYILTWYETPKTYQKEIGQTFKNYWGVYDIHGLVWEWTSDFNSVLISGESRKDGNNDKDLFCGSGSLGATDLMNYAAFIRYAFRGSIKANYSVKNLGFRCVKDAVKNKAL